MAHGGTFTKEQRVFLIVMKLSTELSWKDIAEKFRKTYGTSTLAKDCESKFNKDLKKTAEKEFWERFMESSDMQNEFEEEIAAFALILLSDIPKAVRKY